MVKDTPEGIMIGRSSDRIRSFKHKTAILILFCRFAFLLLQWTQDTEGTTHKPHRRLSSPREAAHSASTAFNSRNGVLRSSTNEWTPENPLGIPKGKAQNLPSIRVDENPTHEENADQQRNFYGGKGDKQHLGGFTELDLHGVCPNVWKNMIQQMNITSLIDVGCGRGTSTSWFQDHQVDTLCVEGSHDAKLQSVLDDPNTTMVEHDFSRGKN